ncbi:MAG: hypothetical protein ACLQLG_13865 [Thermoguttaceae bacterium]
MKRVSTVLAVLLISSGGIAWAQGTSPRSATAGKSDSQATISTGDLKPTEDMWFYQQAMRQYQDPKVAVRHAAEFRRQQRQQRLAAMEWYGLSNSRPRASSDPFHGDYSAGWAANNLYYPYRWTGVGGPLVVVNPDASRYYR